MTRLVLENGALAELAEPFVAAGVLALSDVHVVDSLAARGGEHDADVLLGLAFALRAPRRGHVGVDLGAVPETVSAELCDSDDTGAAEVARALPWPADAPAWHERVCASPLVSDGENGSVRPFVHRGGLLTTLRYHRYETRLKEALLRRVGAASPGIDGRAIDGALLSRGLHALFDRRPEDVEPGPDRQRLGALLALLAPLTVISGGPGTGKTFTVKKILALLHAQWTHVLGRPPRVALAAPTGKAAVRMVEAIGEGLEHLAVGEPTRAWLRAQEASTIHRLLGFDPRNATRFRHGTRQRLPHDVVVVDEASMIDLALMCKLVEAVRDGARLILLGDPNQLASVDAGSVLADLTADMSAGDVRLSPKLHAAMHALDAAAVEGVTLDADAKPLASAIVELRRPRRFRNESGIAAVASAVAEATPASLTNALAWLDGKAAGGRGPFGDVARVPHAAGGRLSDEVLAKIVEGYRPYLGRVLEGRRTGEDVKAFHADVLARFDHFRVLAAHRRGHLGVAGLNATIEEALAAAFPTLATARSFYPGRPILVTENRYEVHRMNGDIGVVVERPSGQGVCVVFASPRGGDLEYLEVSRLPRHETVFAMTIHKSQGSQFVAPVLVLPDRTSLILTRELVYTGVTRASSAVTVAGDARLLREALGRRALRASGLRRMLWER